MVLRDFSEIVADQRDQDADHMECATFSSAPWRGEDQPCGQHKEAGDDRDGQRG